MNFSVGLSRLSPAKDGAHRRIADHDGRARVDVRQQQHAGCACAHMHDAANQAFARHHRKANAHAFALANIQQDRTGKGAANIGDSAGGNKAGLGAGVKAEQIL